MSDCTNTASCCPQQIFDSHPISVSATLDGLLWYMPTVGPNGEAEEPDPVVALLRGRAGKSYTVRLRFRGVIELSPREWAESEDVPGTGNLAIINPVISEAQLANNYLMEISSPSKLYLLNNTSNLSGDFQAVDYQFDVVMNAGARITLTVDCNDGLELPNTAELEVTVAAGDPPLGVTQPFDGQFLQMDVVSVTEN